MPKYAGPLLSSRRSRLSKRIPDISNVDRWLNIVTRKRGVSSMREGYVVCVVERLRIEASDNCPIFIDPPTFKLYITAHRLSVPEENPILRQSPRAVLDHFVGCADELDAPEWVQWSESSVIFQQRASFISKLFVDMASWKHNANEPGLPLAMVVWARSAHISHTLWPMTPTTPRTRREPENTPNHTRIAASSDRQFEDRQFEESPLQGRCIWDVEPTDNLSEEMEPFVAGLIDFGSPPFYFTEAQPRYCYTSDPFSAIIYN